MNNLVFFLTNTPTFPEARCADGSFDPELFFPISHEEQLRSLPMIRKICGSCVHQTECIQYAIDNREQHGIWGGTTPAEREAVWKKQESHIQRRRTRSQILGEQSAALREQGWSWEAIASRLGTSSEYAERLSYRWRKKDGVA